jgi:fructose-bisphosphate aldolase class I
MEILSWASMITLCYYAQGLLPFGQHGETSTRGLESLQGDCRQYRQQGARFAKWRAALKVTGSIPSEEAIQKNAEELAEYAAIAQVWIRSMESAGFMYVVVH